MGRCRSAEVMEYRSKIMSAICDNERLVRLLTPEDVDVNDDDFDPYETLPYKYLMPYELMSGILTTRERFMGFDIEVSADPANKAYRNITLDFFVVCHEEKIKYKDIDYKGYSRCWYDLVACELEEMLCGDNAIDIGVGKLALTQNSPYFVSYAREIPYKGRTITFGLDEFSDNNKYGGWVK